MNKINHSIFDDKYEFNMCKTRCIDIPEYIDSPNSRRIYHIEQISKMSGREAALDMIKEIESKNTQLDDEVKRLKTLLNTSKITIEDLDIFDYKSMYEKQKEKVDKYHFENKELQRENERLEDLLEDRRLY